MSMIAQEILRQLGGSRFLAMTGAKALVAGERNLQFRIPKSNRINKVVITLQANDTYVMHFYNYSAKNCAANMLDLRSDLYADQLQTVFTAVTGLYTKL